MLELCPEKPEYGCKIVLDWLIFHKYTKHYAAPIKKTLMSVGSRWQPYNIATRTQLRNILCT